MHKYLGTPTISSTVTLIPHYQLDFPFLMCMLGVHVCNRPMKCMYCTICKLALCVDTHRTKVIFIGMFMNCAEAWVSLAISKYLLSEVRETFFLFFENAEDGAYILWTYVYINLLCVYKHIHDVRYLLRYPHRCWKRHPRDRRQPRTWSSTLPPRSQAPRSRSSTRQSSLFIYLCMYVCMYVYILYNPLTHWENINNGFE